jgi:hypothetical protein
MVFRWAAALCESMKPRNARLAGLGAVAVVVVVVAAADTAAAVETAAVVVETAVAAVETAVAVAAAHAAGNCRASSPLTTFL